MLGRKVDYSRFEGTDATRLQAFKELQASDIYGGSVFESIGSDARRGQLRHKNNSLEAELKSTEVNYLYGGGYFCLRQVHDDINSYLTQRFLDIYILIPQNEKIDELLKLKYSNDEREIEKSQDLLTASAKNATFETRKASTNSSQFHYL